MASCSVAWGALWPPCWSASHAVARRRRRAKGGARLLFGEEDLTPAENSRLDVLRDRARDLA
eukprot:6254079-Prymnesium_polylepis.1